MSDEAAQAADLRRKLETFEQHARLVELDPVEAREAWDFSIGAYRYRLYYWPRDAGKLGRYVGGTRAGRTFLQLQALQTKSIPAARVIANLKGFKLTGRSGDACIVVLDPNALALAHALADAGDSTTATSRAALLASLALRLEKLHNAAMTPVPLLHDAFRVRGDEVIVADALTPMAGLVSRDRLLELGMSLRFVSTRAERVRMWKHFAARTKTPSRLKARLPIGTHAPVDLDGWRGEVLNRAPVVLPWASLSRRLVPPDAWREALRPLLEERPVDAHVFKDDAAASVWGVRVRPDGHPVDLVVKRTYFKRGLRGSLQRYRRSRSRRAFDKAWRLLAAGVPCELPVAWLERRRGRRIDEQLFVSQQVDGETLASIELAGIDPLERRLLLTRCGAVLRSIEALGWGHYDAKASNWIVRTLPGGARAPVLIDADGVRLYPWPGEGYRRLLRSLVGKAGWSAEDEAALLDGYRPRRKRGRR